VVNRSLSILAFMAAGLIACGPTAPSPGGSVGSLDVAKQPRGVLTASNTQQLWTAYKTAGTCFNHPTYGEGRGFSIATKSAEAFAKQAWIDPFRPDAPKSGNASISAASPPPLRTVTLDEAYGKQNKAVGQAASWFSAANSSIRRGTSEANKSRVKGVIVDWAKSDALSSGIRVSWGSQPVDWQVLTLISSIVATTASLAPEMTDEERATIGPWLNGLMTDVASSRWKDRQDNKAYMTAYISMVWGYMVSDLATVQKAVDVTKLAVHDMRPDGSMPIDSQRSGMGLKYSSDSLGYLVMMAALVQANSGLNLYSYDAGGRSIHNAVSFMVNGIKNPSATNQLYAIPCPDGGDKWGSISNPDLFFQETSSYLSVYAAQNPSSEYTDFIQSKYGNGTTRSSEVFGAPPGLLIRQ
jgi:hypothetical protein